MAAAWMQYILGLALLVIVFVGGTRIGQLQEQDRARAEARAERHAEALAVPCYTCGAAPGQPCIPTRHRVPTRPRSQ
jgi:hypothetical protein